VEGLTEFMRNEDLRNTKCFNEQNKFMLVNHFQSKIKQVKIMVNLLENICPYDTFQRTIARFESVYDHQQQFLFSNRFGEFIISNVFEVGRLVDQSNGCYHKPHNFGKITITGAKVGDYIARVTIQPSSSTLPSTSQLVLIRVTDESPLALEPKGGVTWKQSNVVNFRFAKD
jgi:hypothetical protein